MEIETTLFFVLTNVQIRSTNRLNCFSRLVGNYLWLFENSVFVYCYNVVKMYEITASFSYLISDDIFVVKFYRITLFTLYLLLYIFVHA